MIFFWSRSVVFFCTLAIAGYLSASAAQTETFPVEMQVSNTNAQTQVGLTWTSDADTFYEIYSTTNLASGSWELAVAEPLSSTNLVGQMQLLSADPTRFFQVRKLDTQGPLITERSPGPYAAGVLRSAPLSMTLSDTSGVDTNSFQLNIGGTVLTCSSPGVTASATQFI